MPHYTVTLDPKTVARIQKLNAYFGGSVGGFATQHITDLAQLEIPELITVREQVRALAHAARAKRGEAEHPRPRTRKRTTANNDSPASR